MTIEDLKAYLDNPPEAHAQVCFMYRQAIGTRQQAEKHVMEARAAFERAGAEDRKSVV